MAIAQRALLRPVLHAVAATAATRRTRPRPTRHPTRLPRPTRRQGAAAAPAEA